MRIGIDGRKIRDYGIGTYIQGLLHGLAAIAGPDERYVVLAPAEAAELIPPAFEQVPVDAPHYSARELFVVGRAADRAGLDLFHAPHYVLPFTRCRTVVTIHDLIHLHQKQRNPLAPLYARTMMRRAVSRSARVLTVSESVKREIVSELGVDGEKVVVSPNGIDDRFRAAQPEGGGRYFLYAGNDKPHKDVQSLVEAFSAVRREIPDLSLVLAGAPFERFRSRAGIVTPGFVPDAELVPLYRRALGLVMPSREEGFGLPAAEAMACGTAVITSEAAALVEITGEAAIHAAAGELGAAMLRLASDEGLRLELGRRGIARAARFTWSECARITRRVYLEAIAGG